jgi:hypothetical protein
MEQRLLIASFASEDNVLGATYKARSLGCPIVDVYTPYAVHDLDKAMGLRPSRLPWACFACGLVGAAFALAFQFWTMARDWPVNVGGKPWNSLPAYIPVTFEVMVLLAGLGVVAAFLLRCRLYPGKKPALPAAGVTDDRFVLVLKRTGESAEVKQFLQDYHAVYVEERDG